MTRPEAQSLPVPEAARLIGVSRSTAYKNIAETGCLVAGVPIVHIRSVVRVPRAALVRWMVAHGLIEAEAS